jgi:hypothetical protein
VRHRGVTRPVTAAFVRGALAKMPGPAGLEGMARSTIAIGILVAIGFGLSYVLSRVPRSILS